MPLRAFFDESGTNRRDPAIMIAGFISDEERWAILSDAWSRALTEWEIPYFHMTDFENRRSFYKEWPEEERKPRLQRLLDLIKDHVLASVGVAVPYWAYRKVFQTKEPNGPYLMAAWSTLHEAAQYPLQLAPDQRLAFVFEQGAEGRHQVQHAYDALWPETKHYFHFESLTFASKTRCAPVQAADIIAYELFKHYPRVFGDEKRPSRHPYTEIRDRVPHIWVTLDESQLQMVRLGPRFPTGLQW